MVKKLSDTDFLDLLQASSSWRELAKKVGYKSSSSYSLVKKRALSLGVDVDTCFLRVSPEGHKMCPSCKETKHLDEFPIRNLSSDKRQPYCFICQRLKVRAHYAENKQYYIDKALLRSRRLRVENRKKLVSVLKKSECVDCKTKDIEVLTFDHINPEDKSYTVTLMLGHSWSAIEKEIAKCEIRCANCHLKRTRRQFGYWTVEDYPDI